MQGQRWIATVALLIGCATTRQTGRFSTPIEVTAEEATVIDAAAEHAPSGDQSDDHVNCVYWRDVAAQHAGQRGVVQYAREMQSCKDAQERLLTAAQQAIRTAEHAPARQRLPIPRRQARV